MVPAARVLVLLAAAVLIPACDGGEDQELLIRNIGAGPVMVQIHHEDASGDDDVDLFEIAAGSTFIRDYDGDTDVDVLITRKSDGLVLFSAGFDREDFDDDDGTIEIVVNP